MIEHLTDLIKSPDNVANKTFKEIKVKHFREHGPAILEKLKEWEKEAEKVKSAVVRPASHPVPTQDNLYTVSPSPSIAKKVSASLAPPHAPSVIQDFEAFKLHQLQLMSPGDVHTAVQMPTMGLASSSTPATPNQVSPWEAMLASEIPADKDQKKVMQIGPGHQQDSPWKTMPASKLPWNKDQLKAMQLGPGHQPYNATPQGSHGQPSYAASHHKLPEPPAYTPYPVAKSGMAVSHTHTINYVPHPFWTTSPAKKALGAKLAALANKYQSPLLQGIYPTIIADGKLPTQVRAAVESVAQMRHGCALVWPDYVAASVPPNSAPSTPTEDEQAEYWMTITQMIAQFETAALTPLQQFDMALADSHSSQYSAHGSLPKPMPSSYFSAPYGPSHSTPTTQTNPVSTNASFSTQPAPSFNHQFSAMSIQQPTVPMSQPLSIPFQQSIPLWQDWMKKKAQAKAAKIAQAVAFKSQLAKLSAAVVFNSLRVLRAFTNSVY